MNPTPIKNGRKTVAWACGKCGHIQGSGEFARIERHGLAHDKQMADWCCLCRTCGAETELYALHCDTCRAKEAARSEAERPAREAEWAARNAIAEAALAKAANRTSALALRTLMRDISEGHYCAGWMSGLEQDLWAMVQGGSREYGMDVVPEGTVQELKRLHTECGGWWHWRKDALQEVFVTTADWAALRDLSPEVEDA